MAEWIPANANNFKRGRDGQTISYIIIHTVVGSLQSAITTFQSPTRIASAHYIVGLDGRIVQMVSEADTAYHAGNWVINTQSIGIEHADNGDYNGPRTPQLYEASAQLVADICTRYGIAINRSQIRKHSEVSLAGTACPDSLDIDRIVNRAFQIAHPAPPPTPPPPPPPPTPEWQINLSEIGPHIRKLQQGVSLVNMENFQLIKSYPEGEEITVEFKTKVNGVDFYMTRYSVSKGIPNGFVVEAFDWEKPVVEPPPEEPPAPPVMPPEPPKPPEVPSTPPYVVKPSDPWLIKLFKIIVNWFLKGW